MRGIVDGINRKARIHIFSLAAACSINKLAVDAVLHTLRASPRLQRLAKLLCRQVSFPSHNGHRKFSHVAAAYPITRPAPTVIPKSRKSGGTRRAQTVGGSVCVGRQSNKGQGPPHRANRWTQVAVLTGFSPYVDALNRGGAYSSIIMASCASASRRANWRPHTNFGHENARTDVVVVGRR
jgi:hypothetical protein